MLERFLGKDHGKSTLPKNQIEVVCPVCGAVQIEPRLVVTTLCRKCGEHLRIENRRVIASSQINPVPSAIYPAEQSDVGSTFAGGKATEAPKPAASAPSSGETHASLGLGDMMGFNARPRTKDAASASPRPEPGLSPSPMVEDHAPPVQPSSSTTSESSQCVLPAAPQSTLHRMKEQGQFRQHYFKEVECFECHNKFKVGRSAKTSGCPSCGATICLEDFDINISSSTPIHTRGDVLIRKTANITTSEIICRDLRVFGVVSARIDCSGELLLRCTGTIIGEIKCKKLVVEKGCDVHVLNVIHAGEVEVRARIFANIHCTGAVRISPTGWVHGDVTARSVAIEPGGQLDGSMNILRSSPSPLSAIVSAAAANIQPVLPLAEKGA